MPEDKLFLLDANALCYRSFFAIRSLATSKGQATNAVFGFVNTLRKILKDFQPKYMAICFDVGKKTFRTDKFAAYKIQRPAMPESLLSQLPWIKEVVKAYNLALFEREGFEADDIIATLAKEANQKGLEVVIVSEDKDMFQLVNEHTQFLSHGKDKVFGHKELEEFLGFDPIRIADFIALAGDKVDNIPGIHGIGEVTAKNLINAYGSIERIFKDVDQIKSPRVKEMLVSQKEAAFLSRELAELDNKVPLPFDLSALKVKPVNVNRLFELFQELEFKKFAQELQSQTIMKGQEIAVEMIQTQEEVASLTQKVSQEGQCAFLADIQPHEDLFLAEGVFLAVQKKCFYIPKQNTSFLKSIFEDEKILKITYDIKKALKILCFDPQRSCAPVFDVMLAGYLLSPTSTSPDLGQLIWQYFKEAVAQKDHMAQEVLCLSGLYSLLFKELQEKSLLKLFDEIEMPLAHVLFKMETQGVRIDGQYLEKLSKECDRKIQDLTARLYKLAGEEFNLNSPKQLAQILYQKLGLPVIKKTKTGFSTDEGVLITLAKQHDFPALILEYRQLAKLKSTYLDALPKLVNEQTGRIHAQFNQTGTETGRLSSSRPNLQNLPIRTELGREIRRAIIPSGDDLVMISVDYSQIELRILAHLSGDSTLIKAFEDGQDIHVFTAGLIFDVTPEEVNFAMRDTAKRVNFGIIYGMSAFGLAKDLDISQEQAQEFIDKYFLRYPLVKKFMEEVVKKCEDDGFVSTLLNRRRYIPEIRSENAAMRQFAQRQAVNTPVQGSAADLMKMAMVNIDKEIERRKLQSKMLISVHDELVFEVPSQEKDEMESLARDLMENALTLKVPIKVTIKIGRDWLEMKEV